MISADEVRLAYLLFLGREPENENVVNNLCQSVHSIEHLRAEFYKSAEFRKRMGEVLDAPQEVASRHPFYLPNIPVEVDCPACESTGQIEIPIGKSRIKIITTLILKYDKYCAV